MDNKTLTQQDLNHFTGDLERYSHWSSRRILYTPGVKYLAEHGQAYWLIDAIASYFGSDQMKKAAHADRRLKDMHFWKLEVGLDRSAVLSGRADSGEEPFVLQPIEYTDFPLDQVDIWAAYDGSYWTLYLPSEH